MKLMITRLQCTRVPRISSYKEFQGSRKMLNMFRASAMCISQRNCVCCRRLNPPFSGPDEHAFEHAVLFDQIFGQECRGQNVDHVVSRRSRRLAHNAQCAICRLVVKVNWLPCIPLANSLGIFTATSTICSNALFTFMHCNHDWNMWR